VTISMNRRRLLSNAGTMAAGTMAASTLPMPAFAATEINVGALRFTSHAASFVAFERGYFAEAGLNVTFRFFEAAQPMAVAIASGDADFGVTAISGGLISLAEKGAAKVIGGALQEEKGIDGQMILASNAAYEAGLKSPADLAGRSFGITTAGSSFHYMASKIGAAEGLAPDAISLKPLQKVGAIIGALKSGQIDAWTIVPHIAKGLAGAGAVQHIGMVADYLPDYQVTTVFTSAKLVHKYVYTDRPFEKAAPSIINGAMRINKGAALNTASVEDQLGWFKSEGLVKESVSMETLVDPSYVENA